ncbi:MAG: hemolysin III family protein [Clostridia bacterium]|nr:hemolysin III family protein [Clostridia bacterium]
MGYYTKGEEIANSVTHGIGAVFSIAALTLMVVFAAIYGNAWQVVSVSVYGSTLIILYVMSTLYHAITNEKAKRVLQIFDHSSVYLLIAGTYTPYSLVILRQDSYKGWVVFGVIWAMAVLGITLYAIFPRRFKIFNIASYVVMGWIIVIAFPDLLRVMQNLNAMKGIYWLFAGGLCYTIGVIFYALKKKKYFHSIWHVFVLLGTICHFISVFFYVI